MSISIGDELYVKIDKEGQIPQDLFDKGWHWCMDWDLMLVGPGMNATKHCYCYRDDDKGKMLYE